MKPYAKTHAKLAFFVALIGFTAPAFAEDVSIRTLCQMLPQHVPAASVNYLPGQDVHGRPVAPADVNKVLRNNFDAVEIPVEYSVLNSLNASLPAGSQIQPTVAILRVYHDGRVSYNGQDLTPQAQSLCSGSSQPAYAPVNAGIQQGGTQNYNQGSNPGIQYFNPNTEPRVLGQIQNSGPAAQQATPYVSVIQPAQPLPARYQGY